MRLVDDLIEPFRPMVDLLAWQFWRSGDQEVGPKTKRRMVQSLFDDMETDVGVTPTCVCMQRLAVSVAHIYLGEREKLDLPLPGLPLILAASLNRD